MNPGTPRFLLVPYQPAQCSCACCARPCQLWGSGHWEPPCQGGGSRQQRVHRSSIFPPEATGNEGEVPPPGAPAGSLGPFPTMPSIARAQNYPVSVTNQSNL